MNSRSFILLLITGLALGFSSCVDNDNGSSFLGEKDISISEYLQNDSVQFSMWLDVMKAADVFDALSAYNPYGSGYTMFVPTNEGIQNFIDSSTIYNSFQEILNDKGFVTSLAKFHVLNREVESIDFSFGALPDTTATGDYITIGFNTDFALDSTFIVVNNAANIVEPDIEQSNGVIHIIDQMLEPNFYSAFDWIAKESDLSIFTKALEETGMKDSMKIFLDESIGLKNRITVWVESDEVFAEAGIYSYEDLLEKYDNTGNVKDVNNNLKLFMGYHIMKGDKYLNDYQEGETETEITYANLPMKVTSDFEVKINVGGDDIDTLFIGKDTIPRNYITINYNKSNIATLNGPIHYLNGHLENEAVGYGSVSYHFYENEPILQDARSTFWNAGNYEEDFLDLEDFVNLDVKGVTYLTYSTTKIEGYWDRDWIRVYGDFTIDYYTPKVLPGKYTLKVYCLEAYRYATVQFYWNDFRMGAPIDFKASQTRVRTYELGEVEITRYERQKLTMDAVLSGYFTIFYVRLEAI